MKILIVGGGGREHALAWKLHREGHTLLCAPGNAGIGALAACFPSIKATDLQGMLALAKEHKPDLVLVTPDDPLALGMVDLLQQHGIPAFGPSKAAARIEASKAFAKELMQKYSIPTAGFKVFDDMQAALEHIETHEPVFVVKADGLALGKGVLICHTKEEAADAVRSMMRDRAFGEAGSKVVIEEFLTGPEVSLLCFCDGDNVALMPAAQDHKRALDGDKGTNTGGMGAFAPTPVMTGALLQTTMDSIVHPTIAAMKAEGCPFKGVLYFGLMITDKGPYVIEYNARFGDPETQPIMALMRSRLGEALLATIEGRLDSTSVEFDDACSVCIVAASGGYPGKYSTGYPIDGLKQAEDDGALVFHAGTTQTDDGFATAGGRVLGVTCRADTMGDAIDMAYAAMEKVYFKDMHYRRDIGRK